MPHKILFRECRMVQPLVIRVSTRHFSLAAREKYSRTKMAIYGGYLKEELQNI
jgi:hypothetical protein